MRARNALAIDLGRRRLRAVQASTQFRDCMQVRRVLVCDVPSELASDDPQALGSWLDDILRENRFARGPATWSIGREHVIVKRITLPTIEPAELPDMTRLAMQRESPFDPESAVIDFVPVERHETSTTVLAVAVPRKQVEFLTAVAQAGGLKIGRIALRTTGAVSLVNSLGLTHQTGVRVEDVGRLPDEPTTITANKDGGSSSLATLAIDVVGEGVEFCVLSEGSIRFSRAAEVPAPHDELAMAEAVVTESRRTWMSYRSGNEAGGIGEAMLMGDRRVAEYAAGPVGEMLRLPVRVVHEHPRIDSRGNDLSRVWPLLGLLLEEVSKGERLDFLKPRQAPDLRAQRRQRRLLAAAAVIVLCGLVFTFMRRDLTGLQSQLASLTATARAGDADYARFYRDSFRIQHLREWERVDVNWLEHAMFLAQVAPPPDQIVLDSWAGTLESAEIVYDRDRNRWRTDSQAVIVIEGEARNRATADAFRGALIQNTVYVASTAGADARGGKRMPFGFTYRLRTRAADPPASDAAARPTSNRQSEQPVAQSVPDVADADSANADGSPEAVVEASGDPAPEQQQ